MFSVSSEVGRLRGVIVHRPGPGGHHPVGALRRAAGRVVTTTVIVGNPKVGSRTLAAATYLADQLGGADHVVDLGPGAGSEGGKVVFEGTAAGLRKSKTLTGKHLAAYVG